MALRLAGRYLTKRCFSSAAGNQLKAEMAATEEHAAKTAKLWKAISIFVVTPALALCTYNAYTSEVEHHKHPRPEFVPYSHLRIRTRPFPWGDGNRSFFHNDHVNALPEGYADEAEH